MNDNLTVDLSDGPNPIMTALLRRESPAGYVRERYGLGQAELVQTPDVVPVEPSAVLNPKPWFGSFDASDWAVRRTTGAVLQGLVSATPTGSINLKLRKL